MKPSEHSQLAGYYAGLTDDDLLAAYRAGPGGFRRDVWAIVQAEHARRLGEAQDQSAETAHVQEQSRTTDAPPQLSSPLIREPSQWFFLSRLRGEHWPSGRPLKVRYLRLLGALGLAFGLGAFLDGHQPIADFLLVVSVCGSTFVAAASRSRFAWYYLMLVSPLIVSPLAAYTLPFVLSLGRHEHVQSDWLYSLIWVLLTWLYLCRRRELFGFTPWRFVM